MDPATGVHYYLDTDTGHAYHNKLLLFRNDKLYQLNEDHSLAPVLDGLAALGEMTAAEAILDITGGRVTLGETRAAFHNRSAPPRAKTACA